MRAKEFIVEMHAKRYGQVEELSPELKEPLPGAFVQKELRNTDPYMQYRYGMAVASARAIKNGEIPPTFKEESAFAENVIQVTYTDADEETIKLASDLFGVTPTRIADKKSSEPNYVNKNSPVAKKSKNRFGV